MTASSQFDMPRFVPQLKEYLTVLDSKKRMFLISWITVLASVPDIDMLAHLPELLAGLLDALQDDMREVRTAASKALQVFCAGLACPRLDAARMRVRVCACACTQSPLHPCVVLRCDRRLYASNGCMTQQPLAFCWRLNTLSAVGL